MGLCFSFYVCLCVCLCSTSPSGGNQVDGLPPARHTKTEEKRGRAGACTTILLKCENEFLKMFGSRILLWNSRIVVEYILKFIEMVLKYENAFEISEFYRFQTFTKIEK